MQGNPKLLLGLQYAMVRKEVREVAALHFPTREGEVFVAMGGADFLGLTAPIVGALAEIGLQIRVAVGHANTQREHVQKLAEQHGHVTLIEQDDYVSSLASAHVAVLAAGSSLWEACALGTPTIGIIVADNQRDAARAFLNDGLVGLFDARENLCVNEIAKSVSEFLSKNEGNRTQYKDLGVGNRELLQKLGSLNSKKIQRK
jgi:spore coat polysaccharide biosynthesis predicted glycosyltransferase SpsG